MQICLGGFNHKWLKQEIEWKIIVLLIKEISHKNEWSHLLFRGTMKLRKLFIVSPAHSSETDERCLHALMIIRNSPISYWGKSK